MGDTSLQNTTLRQILNVLERIEGKLDGHEKRVQELEDLSERKLARRETSDSFDCRVNTEAATLKANDTVRIDLDAPQLSRKGTPTNDSTPEEAQTTLRIPYSQWSVNQLDRFFNLTLPPSLEKRLGGCWGIPDDDRLPLKFFKSDILKTNAPYGAPTDGFPTIRQPFESDLEYLCQYNDVLKEEAGNDFMIVDFDESDNTRLYRIGDEAIGSELEVEPQGTQKAPWSRLM